MASKDPRARATYVFGCHVTLHSETRRYNLACLAGCKSGLSLVLAGIVFSAGFSPSVHSEPLSPAECEALAAERSLLEGGGAGENIQRGPQWAKDNLTPEQITYIRRLIEVREGLLFRCPRPEIVEAAAPPPPQFAPEDAPVPGRKPETAAANVKSETQDPSPGSTQPANRSVGGSAATGMEATRPELKGTLVRQPAPPAADIPAPQRKPEPSAPATEKGQSGMSGKP